MASLRRAYWDALRWGRRAFGFRARLGADLATIRRRLDMLAIIERERYLKAILAEPRHADRRRLLRFGAKVYSQNDEDGIIQEIYARIGHGPKTFVEFGVDNGLENNTLKLLLEGWTGLWLEGSARHVARIRDKFRGEIGAGRLAVRQAFVDRDNVNPLIGEVFRGEIDLLSIDVDGNDIYLLEALTVVRPRAMVIEYNGKFPPPMSVAQAYDPAHRWQGTDYGGASLAAVVKIAERKGFFLVGCNLTGANAFFVRQDLLGERFCAPYSAENHYEPARYFLWQSFYAGHPPDWGPYVSV